MAEAADPLALATDEGSPAEPQQGKDKARSPLLPVVLLALLVGPLAAVGYSSWRTKQQANQRALAEWEQNPPVTERVTFPLEAQTVNLADGDRYARVTAALSFDLDPVDAEFFRTWVHDYTESEKPLPERPADDSPKPPKKEAGVKVRKLVFELGSSKAQVEDALIREMSGRRYDELLSEQDKDRLTEALKRRIDEILKSSEVTVSDVYFSEFVMQ